MFVDSISGAIEQLTPNDQTRFHCTLHLAVPHDDLFRIQPGTLVAAENILSTAKERRYTILQLFNSFPVPAENTAPKKGQDTLTLRCSAAPIGLELTDAGAKKTPIISAADTIPAFEGNALVLNDDSTMRVIHQIAPESRTQENGSRIDIGVYGTNPAVNVGIDAVSLLRGNAAVISARPRARSTITTNLVSALLGNPASPVHIVYCDVNNLGTMSLINVLTSLDNASILCLNDKFVPGSVFASMKTANDRTAMKRAVLDYLDMMLLPSVLEPRRHDFVPAVAQLFRQGKITVYRANEQTVDQFINDIRIDILDGVETDVEEYMISLMDGIAETFAGERFGDKNTRDILEMIDEFTRDAKSHAARRTLYDLRMEVQSMVDTYGKDIPSGARRTVQDAVAALNDEARSSLLVVQGQKTTDILRFIGTLAQSLIDERLKRLKIRVPVLFIFNNIDEYIARNGGGFRESGGERFQEILQALLVSGRRHGLGFCLTLESASSLDRSLAMKIQSYFVGPVTFIDEPPRLAQLMNVSEEFLRPAVNYEDGRFLFASADSPYHRRVPLPVSAPKNTDILHTYLDAVLVDQERRRVEYMAQEEERNKRMAQEREERRKRQEEEARRTAEQPKAAPIPMEFPVHGSGLIADDITHELSGAESSPQPEPESARDAGGKRSRQPRRLKAERKRVDEVKPPPVRTAPAPAAPPPPAEPTQAAKMNDFLTFETSRYGGYDMDEVGESPASAFDATDASEPVGDDTARGGAEVPQPKGAKRKRGGRGRQSRGGSRGRKKPEGSAPKE